MRRVPFMLRPAAACCALLIFSAAARAHDFWIEPSAFFVPVGELVKVHLRVGEYFAGEPVVRNTKHIERFVVAGPTGVKPVLGRDGTDPAGLLKLDAAGTWFVGYRSRATAIELPAAEFEKYLREEGLERIIRERATRNESGLPGRERYSRSVKALLRAGDAPRAEGYDRVLGMTLEMVLEADPGAAPGGRLPLRLLHDGKPLAGTLVVALKRAHDAPGRGTEAFSERTDEEGRVVVPIGAGLWLIKAVHMERAKPGTGADWESVWTALTFQTTT